MPFSRRKFMVGCSSAIAAVSATNIGNMVFANPLQTTTSNEIFVLIFCRGGWDALSLVPPFDDSIYLAQRGSMAVSGALPLTSNNPTFQTGIGLHPKAAPLNELYQQKSLAIVHACGLDDDTRSHFEAMDYIERGTPGNKNTSTGWLTRHLQIVGETGTLPTMAAGSSAPVSLLSDPNAVAMNSINSYGLSGLWRYNNSGNQSMLKALKRGYEGTGHIQQVGMRTIKTIEAIQALKTQNGGDLNYTPKAGLKYSYPSGYPTNDFGSTLQMVAHTIKLNMGLKVATVDFGGWDTHESQGVNGDGYFARMVDGLSRGLHAFYNDLSDYWSRLTVVVISEFGRRLGANVSGGTDHGHGNVMLLLGGHVNGGKVYGTWPGLADLDQTQDLRVTTDFRAILGEVVTKRLGNSQLGTVFPGYTNYQPLGIVV
jgi:uncharacterized protein (DUF1501 family)